MSFQRILPCLAVAFILLKTSNLASQTCNTTCTSTSDGTWTSGGGTATWTCSSGSTATSCDCIVLEHDVEIPQNQTINLAAIHLLMKGPNANNGGSGSSFLFNNNSALTLPAGAEIDLEAASILFPQGSNSNTFIEINAVRAWGKNSAYGVAPVNGPASIDQAGVALPVELIYFQARQLEKGVGLFWATASEVNHAFFEVEKSGDGTAWRTLHRVESDGDSFSEKRYEWLDEAPFAGENYYRLRQVDFDGITEYSPVQVVAAGQPETDNLLIVWKKGAGEVAVFMPEAPAAGALQIWNAQGVEVFQGKLPLGEEVVSLPLQRLSPGIYFAGMEVNGRLKTGRFLVR